MRPRRSEASTIWSTIYANQSGIDDPCRQFNARWGQSTAYRAPLTVQEILSRNLRDRRAVARCAGLTGSPDESGVNDVRRAWRRRAMHACGAASFSWRGASCASRRTAHWYRARTEGAAGKRKTTMIVALARKLLIALWRMVTTGEIPAGVALRTAAA
jgi:transposase